MEERSKMGTCAVPDPTPLFEDEAALASWAAVTEACTLNQGPCTSERGRFSYIINI